MQNYVDKTMITKTLTIQILKDHDTKISSYMAEHPSAKKLKESK